MLTHNRVTVGAVDGHFREGVDRGRLHRIDDRFAHVLLMQADDVGDRQSMSDTVDANMLNDRRFAQAAANHLDNIFHRDGLRGPLLGVPVGGSLLLSSLLGLLLTELLAVVMGLVSVDVLLLDAAIFLVADRAARHRSDGTANQSSGGLVVALVADCGTDGSAGQATQDDTATPMTPVLRIGIGNHENYQQS